ncbi:uncharacterized protein MAM_04895 [Metarhizium album ARSEF 1941]|uniref:Uncharacterized protein n=1 Tax=Metarhizium album (strain ARSEF 1941) TaxID=1081103 RepID=A0A0B2WTF0_METAS|nr:uncharacterized protein MAM_04895 [Metarhizium album ARSEF 1941]KHN97298.1 hypothetical protein MAM_04895 [Metarhizium album ARSEF 1941]
MASNGSAPIRQLLDEPRENRSRHQLRRSRPCSRKSFIVSINLERVGVSKAAGLKKSGLDFVELSGGTFEAGAFCHLDESTKKREPSLPTSSSPG